MGKSKRPLPAVFVARQVAEDDLVEALLAEQVAAEDGARGARIGRRGALADLAGRARALVERRALRGLGGGGGGSGGGGGGGYWWCRLALAAQRHGGLRVGRRIGLLVRAGRLIARRVVGAVFVVHAVAQRDEHRLVLRLHELL